MSTQASASNAVSSSNIRDKTASTDYYRSNVNTRDAVPGNESLHKANIMQDKENNGSTPMPSSLSLNSNEMKEEYNYSTTETVYGPTPDINKTDEHSDVIQPRAGLATIYTEALDIVTTSVPWDTTNTFRLTDSEHRTVENFDYASNDDAQLLKNVSSLSSVDQFPNGTLLFSSHHSLHNISYGATVKFNNQFQNNSDFNINATSKSSNNLSDRINQDYSHTEGLELTFHESSLLTILLTTEATQLDEKSISTDVYTAGENSSKVIDNSTQYPEVVSATAFSLAELLFLDKSVVGENFPKIHDINTTEFSEVYYAPQTVSYRYTIALNPINEILYTTLPTFSTEPISTFENRNVNKPLTDYFSEPPNEHSVSSTATTDMSTFTTEFPDVDNLNYTTPTSLYLNTSTFYLNSGNGSDINVNSSRPVLSVSSGSSAPSAVVSVGLIIGACAGALLAALLVTLIAMLLYRRLSTSSKVYVTPTRGNARTHLHMTASNPSLDQHIQYPDCWDADSPESYLTKPMPPAIMPTELTNSSLYEYGHRTTRFNNFPKFVESELQSTRVTHSSFPVETSKHLSDSADGDKFTAESHNRNFFRTLSGRYVPLKNTETTKKMSSADIKSMQALRGVDNIGCYPSHPDLPTPPYSRQASLSTTLTENDSCTHSSEQSSCDSFKINEIHVHVQIHADSEQTDTSVQVGSPDPIITSSQLFPR